MHKDVIPLTALGFLITIGAYLFVTCVPDDEARPEQLRSCMEVATQYRKTGSLWLYNTMNDCLQDDVFTVTEYMRFKKNQVEVEKRAYIEAWKSDSFQFMEKDGIGINKPEGYIK
jgi:hypothetical protein